MSAITFSPLCCPLLTIPVNTAATTARGHVRPPLPAAVVPPFNHYPPVASFVLSQKVKEVVTNFSKHVWRTPVLRVRQSLALSTLLKNKARDGLVGNVADMSVTCLLTRHFLRIWGRHLKCRDILTGFVSESRVSACL
jgi:hypothetical protein